MRRFQIPPQRFQHVISLTSFFLARQHGGFHSIDELRNVSGIGDAKFAEIANRVTV